MARSVLFFAEGIPVPQGSVSAFRGRIVGVKKPLAEWRLAVRTAGMKAAGPDWELLDGPVALDVKFYMPRPKSVRRLYPSVTPDLDKLLRAVGDALTQTPQLRGLYSNDSRIIDVSASKRYAATPGALVTVYAIGGNQ